MSGFGPAPRREFDRHVQRLVNAVMVGDIGAAQHAHLGALAFMARLPIVRDEGRGWVQRELDLVGRLPAEVEGLPELRQEAALRRLRSRGGRDGAR